ncbi:hypothetical protein [Deefgea piscis]|nr:hypothetical protein [Deefgea piscis]
MINAENLVFDPKQLVDLETHVNLFAGVPLKLFLMKIWQILLLAW